MTIFCIRTKRPEDASWRYVGKRGGITDERSDAQRWDIKTAADLMIPHFRLKWPGREFKALPLTAAV